MDAHGQYPQTCPYDGECDQCGYFEERSETIYLKQKRKFIKEAFA